MSRPIRHQLRYMNEIRDFIRSSGKNTSVTITDTIDLYNANPQLLKAVDYVSVNYSPFWERVDVNEGVAATLDSLRGLRKTAANKDKSVVVSETGWSSGGTNPVPGMASPANQAKYFSDFVLMAHSHKDLNDYWSDAFDANWLNEKVVEAHLGVYLKAGQMKDDIFKLENNWRVPRLIRTEGSIMLSEYIGELYMSEKSNEWLTQEQQTWFFDSTTQQIRSKSSDRCLDAYQPWDGGKHAAARDAQGLLSRPRLRAEQQGAAVRLLDQQHAPEMGGLAGLVRSLSLSNLSRDNEAQVHHEREVAGYAWFKDLKENIMTTIDERKMSGNFSTLDEATLRPARPSLQASVVVSSERMINSLTTHTIHREAFVALLAEHRAAASTSDDVVVEAENSSESEDGDSLIDIIGQADF
ncbi:hypothetical protein ON010_g8928 [Phytophthora cinnamomi]|nr:hypothetical protein ON010_g8928 [Phytophthora cinnamomi]